MYIILILCLLLLIIVFNKDLTSEDFTDYNIKYLIKKKPVSFKCYKDYENGTGLLNPQKVILPDIYFNSITDKRVMNFNKFKLSVLDKIKKEKVDARFTEIKNPSINIWEKETANETPHKLFDKILDFHKKKMNTYFYKYIKNNEQREILCPELIDCKTEIIEPGIIRIFESKNWYKFYFVYSYYIKGKVFAYTLFSIAYINKKSYDVKIELIKMIGILHEQDIKLNYGYTKKNMETNINIYNNYPVTPYRTDKGYQRSDNYKNVVSSQEEQMGILKQRKKDNYSYNHKPYCIGGEGLSKESCESSVNTFGDTKSSGIWDNICLKNTDCPFYKANKNYDNESGGCKNDMCEMPLNIKQLGPKTYDKKKQPFCHNCPNNEHTCCDKQKNNKLLKSPDYAFENDRAKRVLHREQLLQNNISIN